MIPGDWGKVGSGWLVLPLSEPSRQVRGRQARFTSSSGGVRAPSVTRARNCAARGDKKPLRVESGSFGGFRAGATRSHPEGAKLLLRAGTLRAARAGGRRTVRETKGAERRDKVSVRGGEDIRSRHDR
jgi:hypothetical protein